MVDAKNTQNPNPEHFIEVAGQKINLYAPTPEQAALLSSIHISPTPTVTDETTRKNPLGVNITGQNISWTNTR